MPLARLACVWKGLLASRPRFEPSPNSPMKCRRAFSLPARSILPAMCSQPTALRHDDVANANGRLFAGRFENYRQDADQTAAVIHCCNFALGAAPTWREAISPPLKIIKVGIDITPYFEAVFGLSSTFSFTILTLPPIAPAISSSAGAIMRHGPHHSAQKSTTTGPSALSTSASKSTSETLPTAILIPRSVREGAAPDQGIAA